MDGVVFGGCFALVIIIALYLYFLSPTSPIIFVNTYLHFSSMHG